MDHYGFCDIHSHFLPGMDDGSPDAETSLRMLRRSRELGVTAMFATPHYYPVETVEAFLERRNASEAALRQAQHSQEGAYPQWLVGAEVAYRPGIGYAEGIEQLCLGNSRFLLLELPFDKWGRGVLRDVRNLCSTRNIVPILAHLERYMQFQDERILRELMDQDVLVQYNCTVFTRWRRRGGAARDLTAGWAHLIGSDCHNMDSRPPNMDVAIRYLEKHGLQQSLQNAADLSMEIFEQAK